LELKIKNIDLLNELATKRVQGMALRFTAQDVNTTFIESLEKLCKKNTGNAALRIFLRDDIEPIQTELLSRSSRVKPTNQLVNDFKKLAEVGIITDKLEVRWLTEQTSKASQKTEVGTISPTFVLDPIET
jgi:DNA polymerase-3 subunit alpha